MSHVVVFCVGVFPQDWSQQRPTALLPPPAAVAVATAWTPAGGAWPLGLLGNTGDGGRRARPVPPLHRGLLYAAVLAGVKEEAAGDRPPRRRRAATIAITS